MVIPPDNGSYRSITRGCQEGCGALCVTDRYPENGMPDAKPSTTIQVGLRLPKTTVDWLRRRALSEERSVSFIVRKLVEAEMAKEPRSKATKN